MGETFETRPLTESDPEIISAAFMAIGSKKTAAQYRRYLAEQAAGTRTCFVALVSKQFAGYVTVNWKPTYYPFVEQHIPEIQDLNVLPLVRRKGIASHLLDLAEREISLRSSFAGIGFGLHPGYNAAQRLYVKQGYIPDGCGVTYCNEFVQEGAPIILDDNLVLHLTKRVALETF